jgi:phenylacetate-CoA ligase
MSLTLPFSLAAETLSALRAPNLPAAQLERLSVERLRKVLSGVKHVPFYRNRMRDAGVDMDDGIPGQNAVHALRSMRPVSKQDLQAAGAAAVKGGQIVRSWYSSLSSGSTGEPLRVYYDARAWAVLKYLVKYRARAMCGLRPHHRVALLDAIPPEREGRSLLERLGRFRRISVFRPHQQIAESLAGYSPDVVYGLPSSLYEVASVLGSRAASIQLRAVFSSGEFLLESVKDHLRQAFDCPVFDVYGSSETKEIAWECREGSFHVNADVVMIEVLQENGEPVPTGTEGEIVATLLVNEAMPLIRYRTGDRGSLLPGRCGCGVSFPRLGVLTGRETDALLVDGGRRISPYVLTCALEQIPGLRRYQVTQVQRNGLRVRAVTAASADRADTARAIETALDEAIPGSLTITVEFVQQLPRGPGAKFRVVEPLRE